jgi:hypothetical protein
MADTGTFTVYGGQGHRRLRIGLTSAEAAAFARDFDMRCAAAGLVNPPTRIESEQIPTAPGPSPRALRVSTAPPTHSTPEEGRDETTA